MARLARVILPGYPHHITQRGNRRQDVFFKEEDYIHYLELLKHWCREEQIAGAVFMLTLKVMIH